MKRNEKLLRNAQRLRTESTLGEILLWSKILRNKQLKGYSFLRQHPIGNYIVDFVCRQLKLVVEIDGYSHNFKYEEDLLRDEHFRKLGYLTVRISESEVRHKIDQVYVDLIGIIEEIESKKA